MHYLAYLILPNEKIIDVNVAYPAVAKAMSFCEKHFNDDGTIAHGIWDSYSIGCKWGYRRNIIQTVDEVIFDSHKYDDVSCLIHPSGIYKVCPGVFDEDDYDESKWLVSIDTFLSIYKDSQHLVVLIDMHH